MLFVPDSSYPMLFVPDAFRTRLFVPDLFVPGLFVPALFVPEVFVPDTLRTRPGMCSMCLACAALWLRSPYGRMLNMFGMCRPMAAVSLWACA